MTYFGWHFIAKVLLVSYGKIQGFLSISNSQRKSIFCLCFLSYFKHIVKNMNRPRGKNIWADAFMV